MAGVVVFHSIQAALRAGYQIEPGATSFGYYCRIMTQRGWARAEIHLRANLR